MENEEKECRTCKYLTVMQSTASMPQCELESDVLDFRNLIWVKADNSCCRFWKKRKET